MASIGPVIAIDEEWYDLEKWAKHHPGGEFILRQFHMQDATDAFYSLHSEKAIQQLKKQMRPMESKQPTPAVRKVDQAFRQFRAKLMNDGWFERSMFSELSLFLPILSMIVFGTLYATTYPLAATIAIAVAMQQAGWLGHDMTHAKDSTYCDTMLGFTSGFINGFNREWWSTKHNTHHVMTNHVGVDPDIDLMPTLFLLAPSAAFDSHFRKYQHFYFVPAYSLLFFSWRHQSLWRAVIDKDYKMIVTKLLPGYIWLACLPFTVALGSVLLGGLLVALVVTQSHEMEEFVSDPTPQSFLETQCKTTRDITCPDPVTEYLFGGMQYQLTHHLFPLLPRYKYQKLQPLVVDFVQSQGLRYKRSGLKEVFSDHYAMLKANSTKEVGSDGPQPEPGWSLEVQKQWVDAKKYSSGVAK